MTTNTNSDIKILRYQGAILRRDAEQMESEFGRIPLSQFKNIIMDFTKVHHICSSALGVLVAVKRRLRNKEGELKLVINDEDLKQVFEITMLDKVFEIYDTTDQALEDFTL